MIAFVPVFLLIVSGFGVSHENKAPVLFFVFLHFIWPPLKKIIKSKRFIVDLNLRNRKIIKMDDIKLYNFK